MWLHVNYYYCFYKCLFYCTFYSFSKTLKKCVSQNQLQMNFWVVTVYLLVTIITWATNWYRFVLILFRELPNGRQPRLQWPHCAKQLSYSGELWAIICLDDLPNYVRGLPGYFYIRSLWSNRYIRQLRQSSIRNQHLSISPVLWEVVDLPPLKVKIKETKNY